jgi:hypothetical protein
VHHLPILSWDHFDRVPRTAIEKGAVRSLTRTLLTTDTEIWIDFDAAEWSVIFIRHPEHARFDRAVLNARGRAGATGAAVSRNREYARFLLARRFAVAD